MSGFVYRPRSQLSIPLRLLDWAIAADSYESVLQALGAAIRATSERIEHGTDEFAESEVEIIENMLGVAYVTCQLQISAVVGAVMNFPDQGLSDFGVRALGPRFNDNYSKVEVLWQLANYFKHRDEWPPEEWMSPTRRTERTVRVITDARLCGSRHSDLRTGAEALELTEYADVMILQEIIRSWSNDVRAHIRNKFSK